MELIKLFVDNMDEGHAAVKMDQVSQYIDDTWFAWVGGEDDQAVFYYRIHSPVILIEFDHQKPVARDGQFDLSGIELRHWNPIRICASRVPMSP